MNSPAVSAPTFPQGSLVFAREPFRFQNPASGRLINVTCGQSYWIGNAEHAQAANGVEIVRSGKPMGTGYRFSPADANRLFKAI